MSGAGSSGARRINLPFQLGTLHRTIWWAVVAASLWLRSGVGIHAIGDASLDDALFLRLARNIGSGLWLGPVDNTTLVKGPFYPLFIIASFVAGIPLKLAEQAVYLAAAALVAHLVARSERTRWGGTALFVALAFNPVLWTLDLSRVIREGLYIGLCLGVVALAALAASPPSVESADASPLRAVVRGLALGLVAGGYWLTREEGIWLVPAVGAVLATAVIGNLAARAGTARPLWPLTLSLLAAALATAAVVGGTMALNQRVYGVAEIVEVNSATFKQAYGALSRIEHQSWQRYVVFPKDARLLAYGVSPAARELQPAFEGEIGNTWRRASCPPGDADACPEILASWFQWALRDAVAAAGHYGTLPEAARYYAQLAREIDDACELKLIPCLPARATLLPPFRPQFVGDALEAAATLIPQLLRVGGDAVRAEFSVGPESRIDSFEEAVGPVFRRPVMLTFIRGWVGTTAGPPRLSIRPGPETETRSDIALTAVDDGVDRAPGFAVLRFLLVTSCDPARCELVIDTDGHDATTVPLTDLLAPGRVQRPGMLLSAENVGQRLARQAMDRRSNAVLRFSRPIGRVYAAVVPPLAAVGLLGLVVALAVRRGDAFRSTAFALGAASLVALVCRVALIAYLDVTSIRSVGVLYLSPAMPFAIVLAVTGTVLLVTAARGTRRSSGRLLP